MIGCCCCCWRSRVGAKSTEERRKGSWFGVLSLHTVPLVMSEEARKGNEAGPSQPSLRSHEQHMMDVWNELPEEIKRDITKSNPAHSLTVKRRSHDPLLSPSPKPRKRPPPVESASREATALPHCLEKEMLSEAGDNSTFLVPPWHKTQLEEDEEFSENKTPKPLYYIKMIALLTIWLVFTVILMVKSEHDANALHQISIPQDRVRRFWIIESPDIEKLSVELRGALLPPYYANLSKHWAWVWLELAQLNSSTAEPISEKHVTYYQKISSEWKVPVVSEGSIDFVPEVKAGHIFEIGSFDKSLVGESIMRICLVTNLNRTFPVSLSFDLKPLDPSDGIIYAVLVLVGLYTLIILEVVHRALAAILASTMSLAILAMFDERPTTGELISWIDVETLLLLFSMMVLVAIFSETGIFDYLAVFAYKITNGRVWPLIDTLCIFTAVISSFLDNVTTALLMTPVTIRLCEVMELNPVPILMAMIMYSNIGGALTPVGDPPNVIIATNKDIIDAGVTFSVFMLHMGVGLFFVMVFVHFQLRFMFRNMKDLKHSEPQDIQELRHEIAIWRRAAASLSSYSKDEDLVKETLLKKVKRLLGDLKQVLTTGGSQTDRYSANLEELKEKYPIRNVSLLIKSLVTLGFVVALFFLHSIPQLKLSLGWAALLGVILLLLLADRDDLEGILARVEWSTLIFFAALFILMEALSQLGLIDLIGQQTERLILNVEESKRLTVAILLILWVSALASSCVDNIPLTTMMVRIVTSLSENQQLNLPLQPLVWALALGACLGGNGTLIGASANVVCAGVAEQHGYRFTFMQFLKIGFPVMIGSVSVITVYLLVAHVVIGWNQ